MLAAQINIRGDDYAIKSKKERIQFVPINSEVHARRIHKNHSG